MTVEMKDVASEHDMFNDFDSKGLFFAFINEEICLEKIAKSKVPLMTPVAILLYDRFPFQLKMAYKNFEGGVHLLDIDILDEQTIKLGIFDQINTDQLQQLFTIPLLIHHYDYSQAGQMVMEARHRNGNEACLMRTGSQPGTIVVTSTVPGKLEFRHDYCQTKPEAPGLLYYMDGDVQKMLTFAQVKNMMESKGFTWL